ncbi:4'-phosphopantetheinyl transferase family protein [Geodermatophilus sp. SYSU D00079]
MIEQVLPAAVVAAEAFGDGPAGPPVAGEELPAGAAPGRRAEFATGRVLARAALGRLGMPPSAVPRGPGGAPVWPAGVLGSLTHCAGYRAAAVARAGAVPVLGVDAEPARPLPPGVLAVIARPEERVHLRRLAAASPGTCWDRLLFCAKEAVFKAWFPPTRAWLEFADVRVDLDPGGRLSARLLVAVPRPGGAPVGGFTGRWLNRDGLLLAAVSGLAG